MPETPFLTARWSQLCLLTYRVPPAVLERHLPTGLTLDLRDGDAFASLVAFDFLDTRVGGVPWPGYRDFPEINLRFYVRQGDRRGVVFVREFVPRHAIALIARALYNEPYTAARIDTFDRSSDSAVERTTELHWGRRVHRLTVRAKKPAYLPAEDSVEHFFKEHKWGFGRTRSNQALSYKVLHPAWNVFTVEDYSLDWDWALVYGSEWAFLQDQQPASVMLAEGSQVAVFPHRELR